ncbi:MAG: DegT/DnrJ/EryC1/StrS family aminotransferase [Polyangiaceae bacterium]
MPRLYLSPPHMGPDERQLLMEAFDSNWIAPLGPHVDAFERELGQQTATAHVAALSSGTAALHLGLMLLDVLAGDSVLVSSFTFAATANAVRYVGAEPIFVDSERATWNIDPDLVAEELEACAKRGKLPKALLSVDLYGQCADYQRLQAVCERFEVPILEDAAEALGATYHNRPAGSFGTLSAFSFNGNKIITTSGGGALCGGDAARIQKARFLATQARDPAPHYEHSHIGYNYRLSNLLAAVGRGQLRQLGQRVAKRRSIFQRYVDGLKDLPGVGFMPEPDGWESTHWLSCVTFATHEDRERARLALEGVEIEARPLWKPMHLQPIFANCRAVGGSVSRALFETGLCLPSGSAMTDAAQDEVIEVVRRAFGR